VGEEGKITEDNFVTDFTINTSWHSSPAVAMDDGWQPFLLICLSVTPVNNEVDLFAS